MNKNNGLLHLPKREFSSYLRGLTNVDKPLRNLRCQLCNVTISHLSIPDREQHYERHFRDDPEGAVTIIRHISA